MGLKPADLSGFQRSGLLWAINQTILWPLGLALTVKLDLVTGETVGPIELSEWHEADGHIETIQSDSAEPDGDRWQWFIDTALHRMAKMPQEEAEAAMARLSLIQVFTDNPFSSQLISTILHDRPKWLFVPMSEEEDQ